MTAQIPPPSTDLILMLCLLYLMKAIYLIHHISCFSTCQCGHKVCVSRPQNFSGALCYNTAGVIQRLPVYESRTMNEVGFSQSRCGE